MKLEEIKTKRRQLLRSKQAKTNWALILIVVVGAAVVLGIVQIPGLDLSGIQLPFSISDSGNGDGPGPGPGEVSVTKRLQFSFVDKYAGTALASDTFYIYDGITNSLLESLTTDADGIKQTAKTYASGKLIQVLYHQGNALVWYPVYVPYMSAADAEANTYNDIPLEGFAIGTYTADTLRVAGTSLADDDIWNCSTSTSPIFSYQLSNTGSDNTGLMNSVDPVYDQNLQACVVVTFSGTGYEHVVLGSDFDQVFTVGTTQYGVKFLSPEQLTLWKVGSSYVPGYQGTQTVSFSLDLTGIVEADSVTMQMTAYAYADPSYAQTHGGSVGNSEVTIAEQTITIDDGA